LTATPGSFRIDRVAAGARQRVDKTIVAPRDAKRIVADMAKEVVAASRR
jgi:hypothetical protein